MPSRYCAIADDGFGADRGLRGLERFVAAAFRNQPAGLGDEAVDVVGVLGEDGVEPVVRGVLVAGGVFDPGQADAGRAPRSRRGREPLQDRRRVLGPVHRQIVVGQRQFGFRRADRLDRRLDVRLGFGGAPVLI